MDRECAAELLGEEDRELACLRVPLTVGELAVLVAARAYARVVAAYPSHRSPGVDAARVGELLAARDALCAACCEVGE